MSLKKRPNLFRVVSQHPAFSKATVELSEDRPSLWAHDKDGTLHTYVVVKKFNGEPIDGWLVDMDSIVPEKAPKQENLYGQHVWDKTLEFSELKIVVSRFTKAVTVNISDKSRTIFSQNFYGDDCTTALALVEDVEQDRELPEDLVFALDEIRENNE